MGKDVTLFKPGDRIFGTTGFRFGAYAEYICLPAESMAGLDKTRVLLPAASAR